jgi:PIN domain nuclease of toxin-antitoxin system
VILLDTHVLIWWVEGGGRLSARAGKAIAESAPALLSPISFWELAALVERGRVEVDRDLGRWSRDLLGGGGVEIAELTASTAIAAALLPGFHGDPADRFIYATAAELGVALVTKDQQIRRYAEQHQDVRVVW